MKNPIQTKLAAAVVAVCASSLVGFYAYEHWPRPQVTASLGAPPTVSPLGAYKDAPEATPAAPEVTITAQKPAPAKQLTKAEEFALLTAKDATPAMLSKAWADVRRCKMATAILAARQIEDPNACELPPGTWQDAQTIRRILKARVDRVDYGAFGDVLAEGQGAFASYKDEWKQLLAEADRTSRENGEPTAMAVEYDDAMKEAQALQAAGDPVGARRAYQQAATFAVANAIGRVWADGKYAGQAKVNVAPDIAASGFVRAVWPLLSKAEQAQAITAGTALAYKWKQPS